MISSLESKPMQQVSSKKLLIFGGNPDRMKDVKLFLSQLENLEIIGAYSQEEGLQIFNNIDDIDMVLIGGRYTAAQRENIKQVIGNTKLTEPGYDYPYSDENIFLHIERMFHSDPQY